MTQKVVLAGGSGFVGQSLAPLLRSAGYEVTILSRTPRPEMRGVVSLAWDGKNPGDWTKSLEGAAAVVNLAGRSINCRHTPENRRSILESRVNAVRVLGRAVAQAAQPPAAFVQASAVGLYGDTSDRPCDEEAPYGTDFMARVCLEWETAFNAIPAPATRKVTLRLGVVLGTEGGFLPVVAKLTRWFLGGHAGSGRQYISWIHMADLTGMFLQGIEASEMTGVFNATSPHPMTNAGFMRQLRHTLHRPWSPPVPELAVRLGSCLLGTEASLALTSQRVVPRNFIARCFPFQFSDLHTALENLLDANGGSQRNAAMR